jgi:hypothetical protein
MKLDASGLESFPSLISHGNDVAGEISAPPSFELPNSNDVSFLLSLHVVNFSKNLKEKKLGFKFVCEILG